jgi:uncharacterized damage-inducible protein DinB
MNPLLHDLIEHQFWADIVLWNAIASHDGARRDKAILDRLHHTHHVQRAFFWLVGGAVAPFVRTKPDDFSTFEELRAYAHTGHKSMRADLAGFTEEHLAQQVSPPWFKEPAVHLTVAEALTQCAMHSHYHRAQNATRLREVGGEPPLTDLIVWYWKGRPRLEWEVASGAAL